MDHFLHRLFKDQNRQNYNRPSDSGHYLNDTQHHNMSLKYNQKIKSLKTVQRKYDTDSDGDSTPRQNVDFYNTQKVDDGKKPKLQIVASPDTISSQNQKVHRPTHTMTTVQPIVKYEPPQTQREKPNIYLKLKGSGTSSQL